MVSTEENMESDDDTSKEKEASESAEGSRDWEAEVLIPEAAGTEVYGEGEILLDVSNASEGYVMLNYNGSNSKVKFQITTPEEVTYTYKGSVTISGNPFDFADDKGTITLVLTQDGVKKTVWEDELGYDDFPRKFEITGWSENNGTVTLFLDGAATGNSYNVEFKKVRD